MTGKKKNSTKPKISINLFAPTTCSMCQNVFNNGAALHVHTPCYFITHKITQPKSKEEEDIEDIYKCFHVDCKKTFRRMNYLRRHFAYHLTRTYECLLCNLKYWTLRDVERHQLVHTPTFNFPCEFCDKKYSYKQMLEEHLQRDHANKRFTCGILNCHKSFAVERALRLHHKIIHEKQNMKQTPATSTSMPSTSRKQKSSTNIMKCTSCHVIFCSAARYLAHEPCFYLHTTLTPGDLLSCDHCDRKFTQLDEYGDHRIVVFTERAARRDEEEAHDAATALLASSSSQGR
jgi:hypothetical protein